MESYNIEHSLRDSIPHLDFIVPVIDNLLYFACVRDELAIKITNASDLPFVPLFTSKYRYRPFANDFGPLNLPAIYNHCKALINFVNSFKLKNKPAVQLTLNTSPEFTNGVFIMGCFAILYLKMTPRSIVTKLTKGNNHKLIGYRDASPITSNYSLSVYSCLSAFRKALKFGIFNIDDFNVDDYLFYYKSSSGDINFIIPDKLVAFSDPHHSASYWKGCLFPDYYIKHFRKWNVTSIARLNAFSYDPNEFVKKGIDHADFYFPDGSTPSREIVERFLKFCGSSRGLVAVHCKAGLGRTGTLIACYMMVRYKFTAPEAIGWIRICRPGSIVGPQQQWLDNNQMWLLGCKRLKAMSLGRTRSDKKRFLVKSENINRPLASSKLSEEKNGYLNMAEIKIDSENYSLKKFQNLKLNSKLKIESRESKILYAKNNNTVTTTRPKNHLCRNI